MVKPQYTDKSSGNVFGRSTEQPTYQQQLTKQPVNAAILNAVTGYGADIIESPVQTLAIDPAVAAVKTPAKTLQAFGDLTSARLQGVTGRPNQQKLESGLTSLAEAAGGAAEVVGVGLPLAKAGAKPLRASLDNLLSKDPNRLQPKPVTSISDDIAEQVGTADKVTPVVDDAVDAAEELMPPSRIVDDAATTTPFANETTKSMQETYGYLQKQSGMKPKEFKEFLENARTDPESAEMLFNINNRFTVTARGLGAKPASEEIITKGIIKQSADQARRINKSFDAALGNPDTAFQTLKGIKAKIKSEASPLYNKAYSQEFVMTQGLQDVMSIPLLGKYEKSAVKRLKELKKPTGKLRVLHQVKRKLDGDIGKAIKSGASDEVSDLLQLKNNLLDQIDIASPNYKKARKIYANQKANENALIFGEKNIFSGKVNAEEFAEEIKDYSKSELESLRVGIKKAISKVEAGKPVTYNAVDKKFIIPNTRAKLEIAIGKDSADKLYQSVDAEAAMFRQSSSVAPLGNSRSLLNAEAIQQAELGLKNPLKIGIAKAGQAVVEANANPATLLGRGVSGIVKKGTDSVSASYNEQLAKAAADVLTRPANEGIEMLLAAAPQEKVGIARQIIAKTEGQPSTEVTLQANNVVDAADIINAPQKQGIDTLQSVASQKKVGIAREIISQTQGKPVTPLKRKAIEVLSAQALNPEMQNIARGLGGAGAVSATSSDEPNVLSNMLAAPNAEEPKTATNIQDLPAGAVIYPNNYNELKSGDIYYKKVNGAYVGYRKK